MDLQLLATLEQNPLIGALPKALRERLLQLSVLRQVPAHTTLFNQGDASHDVFVVVEGSVTLSRRNRQDRELVIARLHPADIFGEIEWLDGGPRLLSAKTDAPCALLVLDAQQLHTLEQGADPLGVQLLHLVGVLLSQRLRSIDRQMLEAMVDPSILAPPSARAEGRIAPDRDFFHDMMAGLFASPRDRAQP